MAEGLRLPPHPFGTPSSMQWERSWIHPAPCVLKSMGWGIARAPGPVSLRSLGQALPFRVHLPYTPLNPRRNTPAFCSVPMEPGTEPAPNCKHCQSTDGMNHSRA